MRRARFAGAGAALPSQVVANAEIEDRLGVERGWIERTGIRERRVLAGAESLVDLAEHATRDALAADYERVVVVGADCLSAFVDPSDRATAPLFGDGAGAVVLEVDTDARPEA